MKNDLARPGLTARSGPAGILVLLGTIAALYFTREILIPLAFALTLTFLLTPVVSVLQKLRIGRAVSVLTTVLAAMAIGGGIAFVIAGQLVDVANQLPQYRQNIRSKLAALHMPSTGQLGRAAESVKEIAREITGPDASSPPKPSPAAVRKPAGPLAPAAEPTRVAVVPDPTNGWTELRDWSVPILAPVGRAGIVVVFAIFMLMKREDLRNRFLRLAGLDQLNLMTEALDDAAGRVSRYLRLQFLVNAGLGVLFGLGLYWIGVPNPALWGAVAGILRIVPYVGTLVAATLPIALSLAVFDGWLKPLLVCLLIGVLELVIANFFEPWLYGAHVGISSLGLLVTAVFWTVLWGAAGLILSTPLTVCVVVLGRYVPQLSFLHILLGDEPVLKTEARLYQRLLAMDQMEAHTIVTEFLKSNSIVELYDSVLIPALTLAEQDRHKGAMDASREEFLFLSVSEMIVELSEYRGVAAPLLEGTALLAEQAEEATHRILCVPSHDQADEITAAMLAQLLDQEGFTALSFPIAGPSPQEWMALMGIEPTDLMCITALPPYAFGPARTLCKQIRERFPKLKIVVCVLGFTGDTQKAMSRFERTQPERLATSLAEAVVHVRELTHPELIPTPAPAISD